jgi:hypothetical protein
MNKEEEKALQRINQKLDRILDKLSKPLGQVDSEKNQHSDQQTPLSFAERQTRRGSPKQGK